MLDGKTKFELNKLFLELTEGSISDTRLSMLDEYLRQDPEVQAYYCQFMHTQVSINKVLGSTVSADSFAVFSGNNTINDALADIEGKVDSGSKFGSDSNFSFGSVDIGSFVFDEKQSDADDSEKTFAMLELLEMERTSPAAAAVVVEKSKPVEPKRQLIQKVDRNFKFFPGEGNKPLLVALRTIAACIIVFIGYIYFTEKPPLPTVAELVDSVRAEWDEDLQMPDEYGQMLQSRYRLKEGYASILFDSGTMITVEAPAELSLLGGGNMELFSGKIYAVVPKRAVGFTVMAGNNKIVDLGTEFGVEVDSSNNIQLHVTSGKTRLFAGLLNGKKSKINVDAGAAKKVYRDGYVRDIGIAEEKFVRHIDSETGVVWNGKFNIDEPGGELIFSESFESPVVEGYLSGSVPDTGWIGSIKGHRAKNRGLYNEGDLSVFSTPYGRQGYLLNYTNTGLTTSETAITEVLTAGKTYKVTFNMASTLRAVEAEDVGPADSQENEPFELDYPQGEVSSRYRVELVAFGPDDDRKDVSDIAVSLQTMPGTILAFTEGKVTSNDMTDSDSIAFTPKADDPNLGKKIAIRLVKRKGSVLYDNVQLRVKVGK